MNFNEQSIEMKRTLLEASVGSMTLNCHMLEVYLKIILFSCLALSSEKFEAEWNKPRVLGSLINELRKFPVFTHEEIKKIDLARKTRNEFTHNLSAVFEASIKQDESMQELIENINEMKDEIVGVTHFVKARLHEQASLGGVNVELLNGIADKQVSDWEDA